MKTDINTTLKIYVPGKGVWKEEGLEEEEYIMA